MHIFVTGGSKGIGRGIVVEFLKRGHSVSFTGTSIESLNKGSVGLTGEYKGFVCDVTCFSDLVIAKDKAIDHFQCIDIWINNAGVGQTYKDVADLTAEDTKQVIDVNVTGMIYGTTVALNEMKKQNFGAVYNMEGLGSDGRVIPKTIVYGSSKRLLRYFSNGVNKELKEFKEIYVGTLSPGMVFTDLLLKDSTKESMKIINILGNRVEEVTPYLVEKMIKGKRNINWLTNRKVISKFIRSFFKKKK